ncbi:Fe(2+) transporter permease subunit FeoB [Candidatus Parabeggiatoa sp. HSG14]|uniref:Fe(2+) transporter permease subunit FeoB n=1 Tax=Candidatus Parabeggiatoa sp. HSG14 TaxID=3055593 RepID=UPI0025A7D653|nr:Fe(2+) transporter permease subunit FeoB [Thiotrichales bacterium HSG14]
MKHLVIGVVGNPNCGKTTLFNVLTGTKQRVGNWPGVTVERKEGFYKHDGRDIELVDLPGTYSLEVMPESTSLDEQIAQDYILSGEADLIVNIVDASNLERNLYLTTQLLEMEVPLVVALNMMDIAKQRDIKIDIPALSQQLGVPVIPLSAAKHEGIEELKHAMDTAAEAKHIPSPQVEYPEAIEEAINQLLPTVIERLPKNIKSHAHWVALKLLENDSFATHWVGEDIHDAIVHLQEKIEEDLDEDVDIIVADSRYTFIGMLIENAVTKTSQVKKTMSDKIDKVVLNRVLGIPIFLFVMYLMFMFTINIGGALIDFFDIFSQTILVDGFGEVLTSIGTPVWLTILLADGIGGGIQVVATFIPIIGFLYLFLSFLEDSGYMARAAFVMDRFMRFIGLPGKSFVPLIVGFGCNVPAIMATRTLETQRDRFMTILMNPFMSCGARLPVYALFAAAFFPVGGQNIVFGLYLIGIAVAVITGLIMKNTLLKGETSPFVMELPLYHLPTLQSILLRTWDRLKNFIFKAGQVIVPMVLVLTFLNSWGTDGTFGNENTEKSVLSEIGRSLTPAFEPMGIHEENWPATVGIFTGVLAKEAVVGTLDAIYSQMAVIDAGIQTEEEAFNLWGGITEAFETIPTNLSQVMSDNIFDPLGINIGDVSDTTIAAEAQAVSTDTFGAMATRFEGQTGAFAYMLFILLYFPCVAAIAAVYRETSMNWTIFVAAWSTGLAYLFSVIFYQLATFAQHPLTSLIWTSSLLFLFGLTILVLYIYGKYKLQEKLPLNTQQSAFDKI